MCEYFFIIDLCVLYKIRKYFFENRRVSALFYIFDSFFIFGQRITHTCAYFPIVKSASYYDSFIHEAHKEVGFIKVVEKAH